MRGINFQEDFGWSAAPRFGGGGGGTTQTVQKTDNSPWVGQQPALSQMFSSAQNLYGNPANYPQYFPTSTYQPMTDQQTGLVNQIVGFGSQGGPSSLGAGNQALTNLLNTGSSLTQPTFGAANNQLQGLMGMFGSGGGAANNFGTAGNALSNIANTPTNPFAAPGFQNAVNTTLANVIPATSAGFIGGGRADSGLAQAAQTAAATNAVGNLALGQYNTQQGLNTNAANALGQQALGGLGVGLNAAQLAGNNYINNQGQLINAANAAPGINQSVLGNLTGALGASTAVQQDLQGQLTDAVNRWNYNQTLPWNMLTSFQNAVGGTGYGSQSNSTATQPFFTNTAANIGSVAGGIGSLIGGLALAFSDRDLKTDIHKVGESDSGFPLYSFRYKGEAPGTTRIGLMAQDVMRERPEAVARTPWGLAVHYDRALAA